MAVDMETDLKYEIKDLKQSLRTAGLELSLERSKHSVEIVAKDEDMRKLRVGQCLLQDENGDLHEQLEEEQTRSDGLEAELNDALAQLDEQTAAAELAQNQIRMQAREVANLKAELKAMENVTSDSDKILSEKLALTRELSSLRPEVEHLRAQVETNNGLLTEKLSLQRQLTTAQVELENEKRTSARTLAKQGKRMEQDEVLRTQLEELRNELAQEKKDRIKIEAALAKANKATEQVQAELETQQQEAELAQAKLEKREAEKASKRDEARNQELEQLRQDLAQERSARVAAEKVKADDNDRDAQIEELQQQLDQEERERQKLEKAAKKASQQSNQQPDATTHLLKKELEAEKRERKQQEKEYSKTLSELQAKNTILDDKLNAFREKLRSTKATLKQREEELERAERAQTAPPTKFIRETSVKPVKGARKRMAASVEPETNLGTPGDGFPAKKTKRGAFTAIGDTSNFSLTPFLNRTVVPSETILEQPSDEEAEIIPGAQESTPTAPPSKRLPSEKEKTKAQPKILAPSASNKANAKPGSRKRAPTPALDIVAEEASQLSSRDNSENIPTVTVPIKTTDGPAPAKGKTALVPKVKPRKSLMSFATFTEEPAAEKKKKRKLGASGLGKTLFDDDDEGEDEGPLKPKNSKGIFAARALGGFSKAGLGKGRGPISGGYNMMSDEGFTFSPLKKDRRAGGPGASFLK